MSISTTTWQGKRKPVVGVREPTNLEPILKGWETPKKTAIPLFQSFHVPQGPFNRWIGMEASERVWERVGA